MIGKKINAWLHLWLGLSSGLIVCIISITGCIYVFEDELKSYFYKYKIYVEVPENTAKKSISELLAIAQKTLGKDHPIQNIEISTEPNRSVTFRPAIKRNEKALTHFGEYEYSRMLYINPYSGKIIANEDTRNEFFRVVLALHRNLLLKREVGLLVVGIAVLIFVILLISGIVLWWPKNWAAIKQRMSFQWKKTTKNKRKNYDLHNILGFYTFVFLLIIALTGLTWSFDWAEKSVAWIANGGVASKKKKPVLSDTTQRASNISPLDIIYFTVISQNIDAKILNINMPKEKKAAINVSILENEQLNYNRKQMQFDQFTGEILKVTTFDKKDNGEKLKAMNYDIHTGRILSLPGKILAFIASLVSASLPITGALVWWGRLKKKN